MSPADPRLVGRIGADAARRGPRGSRKATRSAAIASGGRPHSGTGGRLADPGAARTGDGEAEALAERSNQPRAQASGLRGPARLRSRLVGFITYPSNRRY